ncbi:MAG TPA: hypothetical protein VI564_03535 [Candidatus Nanoarchaeia archaeon]|nr:hypothetical protein [Candidatus Nanoarchaeia archaeon]
MNILKLKTKKGIFFLFIFSLAVFAGGRINFSRVIGTENQFFTLFQFLGPLPGAMLGPAVGGIGVLIAELFDYLIAGKAFTLVNVLRLAPMIFAAWYFGTKKGKLSILVPLISIMVFIAHPVGRQVWYFSLFWTIPIIINLLPKKYSEKLFLKSLGATFTAHSVGGALWNYIVPMTPEIWISLVSIVIFERLIFATGISVSFILFNFILDKVDIKSKKEYLTIDKRYIPSKTAS